MAQRFSGKVALVTGAAQGIGLATAVAFAREGAFVVVSDVSPRAGEAAAAKIRNAGGAARFARCDVSDAQQVRALVDGAAQEKGRLDVAFNNAGISGTQAPLEELTVEAWNQVLAVNLSGVFHCLKAELSVMGPRGRGAIVNNASILGTVGFAGAGAYTAAKHGVLGLTKVAALESAPKGVRVNAVCPGFIVTPMLEGAGLLEEQARAQLEALHPLGRLGDVDEVAEAVLFLCSEAASFITGHPLLVDGGYVAR